MSGMYSASRITPNGAANTLESQRLSEYDFIMGTQEEQTFLEENPKAPWGGIGGVKQKGLLQNGSFATGPFSYFCRSFTSWIITVGARARPATWARLEREKAGDTRNKVLRPGTNSTASRSATPAKKA